MIDFKASMTEHIIPAVALGLVLGVFGCATVDDMTRGESPVCGVHGVRMSKKLLPLEYGLPVQTASMFAYTKAWGKEFPHAEAPVGGGCIQSSTKYARIYVCPKCTEAREAWLHEHKEFPK
jgi:hypothetical protein